MGEQLHSESFHRSLADCYHDPVISIGRNNTCCQYHAKLDKPVSKRCKIRIGLPHHWHDILIDQGLHK